MIVLRGVLRMLYDMVGYAVHSGRWWLAIASFVILLSALLSATAKVVVGPVVYAFF